MKCQILLEKFLGIILYSAMLNNIGNILSYILHPMIVSTFTFWFIIYQTMSTIDNRDLIFFLSFFFSTVLPVVAVLYLKNQSLNQKSGSIQTSARRFPITPQKSKCLTQKMKKKSSRTTGHFLLPKLRISSIIVLLPNIYSLN